MVFEKHCKKTFFNFINKFFLRNYQEYYELSEYYAIGMIKLGMN